ncbi:hypothetical protein M404DRAFT_130927 [Pisolithus tinctorius Marx 270]|uniref:Expansin-like EG45 domain-containing protein n=1 Tax=Pisolithus tinctorius Marx 270 TaxID=870435 RepID=A0A0C3P8R1_PISTI|nr:hypothetical protein M404DRAFT_130927 [Pisolithus tinctorius Marx 270]
MFLYRSTLLPAHRSFVLSALLSLLSFALASDWIQYPSNGYATMTHYTLPEGFIAACGCAINSTLYPTAAMNQMAYGSSTSYGPACGQCFNLTLLDAFTASPPFHPNTTNSVVVKITDLCPYAEQGWCNATTSRPNAGGEYLNFDLSWPSASISSTFFPSDASYYGKDPGYSDFGVWNISYRSVSCEYWEGWNNSAALGSVANLGYVSCCPDNPMLNSNDTCPSYSDQAGISPYFHAGSAVTIVPMLLSPILPILLSVCML